MINQNPIFRRFVFVQHNAGMTDDFKILEGALIKQPIPRALLP